MVLRVDIVAELNERAATAAANRLKGQMVRAGEVSGEAFRAALEKEAQRSKIATDKLQAELRSQFTKHGEHAGASFGTGFGSQMVRSLPGVSGFTSAMAGYEGAAAKSGALAGRALGLAFTTAAGGLMGAAAYTLFKGFERYETIDAATHRLQNLSKTMQAAGQTGLDVAAIMKTVNDVVLGTPIGLDKAMGAVTVALGSGVKQGDELKRYLTDIADAAGYSGRSFEEIALVFGQVQAKGRLMGEEVLQLAEKNIPAAAWLKDTFKLTGDEYERMQEKGQISLKALEMAIEQHAGGQAKAMGETIQGAISNVQSSISRTGANFLAAIFGKPTDQNNTMVEALKSIKDRLDEMGAWVSAHQAEIHDFFQKSAEAARDVAKAVDEIGKTLSEHKDLIKTATEGFLIWKGMKFTGLLSGMDAVSGKLGSRGGGGIIGQLGVALLMFGELNRLKEGQHSPSDGPNFGSQGALAGGGAMLGWQLGGPWGAGVGALLGAAAAPVQDYANPPGPSQTGALPGAPGVGTGPGGKREARTPQELYMYGPGFSVPTGPPAPKPGGPKPGAPGATSPTPPPWTAPGGQQYVWDWNKGGYTPTGPTAPGWDNSNPFLSPRDSKDKKAKAPVVPYDTTLPPGFDNLPMSSSLYGAESSYLDSRHKLAEKRARLEQLEHDSTATEQDVLDARNDVIEAQRDQQQSELRLYEERDSIYTKSNKQLRSWISELGDIGAGLDKDFGISKGLAGIAENITKFIANLAAAPLLGQLAATQMVAGYKPGEAGSGIVGSLAASGAFGSQYQMPGSIAQALAKGRGGFPGMGGGGGLNWDALAAKESSGNWGANTDNGYFGGLQFDQSTWNAYKPPGAPDNPAMATREQQIQAGINGIRARGGPQSLWPQNWQQLGGGGGGGGPLGLTGGGLFGGAGYSGGGAAGAGMSARDYAHNVMMPYWQSMGLTVGDHAADQYGEHQNGALDIMVPDLATGQQVLQQVLSDANVYGAIFNRNSYGYGHGNVPQPYTGDNPHTDHVHAWYKPGGAGNIPVPGMGMPGLDGIAPGGGGGLGVQAAGFGQGGGVGSGLGGGGGAGDIHGWGSGGGPGPGLPGLPGTSNPTRIGGVAQPQGKGSGGVGPGGLLTGAMSSAISMAGMAGDAFAPGGGQAAAAAAQTMMQLAIRGIQFGSQAVGIGVQGIGETLIPAGSDLAANSWFTKLAGGIAGAGLNLPNVAGKGDDGSPTPEQVVGQGQGLDGRPAGLPDPAAAGNTDNSKNVSITNNNTFNAANMNENSMASTVAAHQMASYNT